MVEVVSDKAACPLLSCLDWGGILCFGDCAMVAIIVVDLLFSKKV